MFDVVTYALLKKQIASAAENLDYNDVAIEKNFVTEVKQADGAIAVKRAPVADIALTGNVTDLVQTDGNILILNCGTSDGERITALDEATLGNTILE